MPTQQLSIITAADGAPASEHSARAEDGSSHMAGYQTCSSIGTALLRDYAGHLDPLNTISNTALRRDEETKDYPDTVSSTSTLSESPLELPLSSPSKKPIFPFRAPKSFLSHRNTTPDSGTKQTITKTFISRSPTNSNPATSLAANLSTRLGAANDTDNECYTAASPHRLSVGLAARTPATAKFASLKSPCLFHQCVFSGLSLPPLQCFFG